ncbi:hypothetical protein, partial [Rhizobium mesosinicum]|uniref:hypothetical protein n=1 Tax=Rhizobium mesosinicum TaxID=335017 RepID=UPI001C6F4D3C
QSNKPASANPLDFLRTRNFVASSAAALVSEWAYNPTKPKQSTALFRKNHFSSIPLFLQKILYRLQKAACFPDSDYAGKSEKHDYLSVLLWKIRF